MGDAVQDPADARSSRNALSPDSAEVFGSSGARITQEHGTGMQSGFKNRAQNVNAYADQPFTFLDPEAHRVVVTLHRSISSKTATGWRGKAGKKSNLVTSSIMRMCDPTIGVREFHRD